MNMANKITFVRIILIPFIILLMLFGGTISNYNIWTASINMGANIKIGILWVIAGILFIIAAFSDFLDGYIARKYKQVTNWGKIIDPIADKVLVNSVLIVMTITEIVPVWVTLILIVRDIIIDGIRMFLATKKIIIPANYYGKLKTLLQMCGITLLFFINHIWFNWANNWSSWQYHVILLPMYLAMIFSVVSAVIYCFNAWKLLH